MTIKKSFVVYMGSKYLHIKEILSMLPRFTRGLDVFGGSGVVAMNLGLDYNDLDPYVARCYQQLKQEDIDEIIERFALDKDLIITEGRTGNKQNKRVHPDNFEKLITAYKADLKNIQLEFLVRYFMHSMGRNDQLDRIQKGRAGKYVYPRIINRELFLNRAISHKSFIDIDFNNYDFLFIDPPYLGSEIDYCGWVANDEVALLDKLSSYKGRFLMTNYLNDYLVAYIEKNGWYSQKIATKMNSANLNKHNKAEWFVYNYKHGLF